MNRYEKILRKLNDLFDADDRILISSDACQDTMTIRRLDHDEVLDHSAKLIAMNSVQYDGSGENDFEVFLSMLENINE